MSQVAETKKAITVVDKAVKSLSKANADLTKMAGELSTLSEMSADLLFDIEMKSSKLEQISAEIAAQERDARAELAIRIKENENGELHRLLKKREMVGIPSHELEALEAQVKSLREDQADAIAEALDKQKESLEISYSAEITRLQAQHEVDSATLKSDNAALSSKIEYLTKANAEFQEMLNQERNARVQTAANTAQPVFNLGQPK